jgi:hypothetical protein
MSKNPRGRLWKVAIEVGNKLVRWDGKQSRGIVHHGVRAGARNIEILLEQNFRQNSEQHPKPKIHSRT